MDPQSPDPIYAQLTLKWLNRLALEAPVEVDYDGVTGSYIVTWKGYFEEAKGLYEALRNVKAIARRGRGDR